jgi:hypothetical protein
MKNALSGSALTAMLLAASAATSHAQILVYAFNTGSPATATVSPTSIAAHTFGSVFSSVDAGTTSDSSPVSSGYSGSSGSFHFVDNNWNSAAPGSNFFQFTITPDAGYEVSVSSLSFGYRRTSTGPTSYTVRSSVDGYSADLGAGSLTGTDVWSGISAAFPEETSSSLVTFRIYASDASSASGTLRIDDVKLFGTVSAIPEPSIYALAVGLATLGIVGVRRWRRRELD